MISENDIPRKMVQRYLMLFLNAKRKCIFRQDFEELTIGDWTIGPFRAGEEARLPNWIIEKLDSNDIVDIAPEDALESLRRLQNQYRAEDRHPHKLQSFHPHLYAALERKMTRLQSDKTSLDPRSFDEIEKMQRMIPSLVETRLSKIIRVAKSGAYQDKREYMTMEERWLCEELVELLSSWRTAVREWGA
ncbi:MAG: hypothetical protein GF309_12795 [Candidatus Lokiarchaeota archaeon]|nr:hypothetical protein [Candidatus Lokiarchaeota archaeon]